MFKNSIITQDISKYTQHSKIVKAFEEKFICEMDKEDIENPTYQIFGSLGLFYSGLEYIPYNINKFSALNSVKSSKVSGDLSAIYTNVNSVDLHLIKLLRSAESGYLILMGYGVSEVVSNMIDYKSKVTVNSDLKIERDQLKETMDSIKSQIKVEKKKLKEEALKSSVELTDLENQAEDTAKLIFRNKELVKSTRISPASFLIEHLLEFGVFNVLRGFSPIYIEDDLMILKVNDKLIQGVNQHVVNLYLNCLEESREKDLSIKKKISLISEYLKSSDIEFTYEVPEFSSDLYLLGDISEMDDLNISSNIYMTDAIPVAPIKPHIVASLLASGTAGSLDKEVIINENENASIKSVMLPEETISTVYINGDQVTEKITTWKPRLGIYNKLRKEVEILRD